MNDIAASDLKSILHSKRAKLYYLEHCRVMQKDGRILYLTDQSNSNNYYNIAIANTTVLLLGTGTSITQAAVRMLAQAGVLIGFCGGGGTPLFMGNEIEWLSPQSEYRPTEYVQQWLAFWFDEALRLKAAKILQHSRMQFLKKVWAIDPDLKNFGIDSENPHIADMLAFYENQIERAENVAMLLASEAKLTKELYKIAANATQQDGFSRDRDSDDLANAFLNHGNYLAYGLAASTLWVLGIPHGFAVMHGKTRRGALVFDIADIVKDAIVLPRAFISAADGCSEKEFRQEVLQAFAEQKALDEMFDQVKNLCHSMQSEGGA